MTAPVKHRRSREGAQGLSARCTEICPRAWRPDGQTLTCLDMRSQTPSLCLYVCGVDPVDSGFRAQLEFMGFRIEVCLDPQSTMQNNVFISIIL